MSISTNNKLLEFLIESSYQVEDLLNYHEVFDDEDYEYKFKEAHESQHQSSISLTNNLTNCNHAAVQFLANATLPQQQQTSITSRLGLQQQQHYQLQQQYNYINNQLEYPSNYLSNGFAPIQHFSQSGYTSNDLQQHNYISLTSTDSTQFSAKLQQTPAHYPQVTGFAYLDEPSQQQQHQNSITSTKQAELIEVPEYRFECAYCYYLATTRSSVSTIDDSYVSQK